MPKTVRPDKSRLKPWQIVAGGACLAMAAMVAPDPIISPTAWAAENIIVPDGPYAGQRWSAPLTPYISEPLDCLASHDPSNVVSVRKCAQSGFTGLGIAWLGTIVDKTPAQTLVVQPTVDAAKDFNREKLALTIRQTRVLRRKVRKQSSRDGEGSTTLTKVFDGGFIDIAGANSAAGLRSKTVKNVFGDEIDEWPADLDGQGDPMRMVDARQMSFRAGGGWKKLQISTPTLRGASRIDDAFEAGDQRYFNVPCPHCGEIQVLEFDNLRFEDTWPHRAEYVCSVNGCVIAHKHKHAMVATGRWIAKNPAPGRQPSFHLDTLIVPFVTWDDIAVAFLDAGDDPHKQQTFWNLWLARSYEIKGEAPAWETLQRRAQEIGSHSSGVVPGWVLFLTMGVDVQGDRLEASVWGFGVGKTCALIDHYVLTGDTNGIDVWIALTELWQRTWLSATLARVIEALVGHANTVGPSMSSLAGNFGLEPLIGKQVATISDMRLGRMTDTAALTETLLKISGEDTVSVPRKYKAEWTGKLAVRFLILTNEDFKLKDTSGALANRFVGLQFYKNWLGCEDRTLTAKLKAELPGILNWTIEGWRRLNDDGAFNETTQSKAIVRRIHATGDQVAAFFYDRCKLDPLGSVPKARLLDQYEGWTRENDIRFPLNEVHFGRAILLCGRGEIIGRRVTSDGRKYQVYVGLKLLGDDAPAQEGPTSDQGGLP